MVQLSHQGNLVVPPSLGRLWSARSSRPSASPSAPTSVALLSTSTSKENIRTTLEGKYRWEIITCCCASWCWSVRWLKFDHNYIIVFDSCRWTLRLSVTHRLPTRPWPVWRSILTGISISNLLRTCDEKENGTRPSISPIEYETHDDHDLVSVGNEKVS